MRRAMKTYDDLLTLQEAQDILRCGKTKIYELEKEGRLELVKLGPRTRVTGSSMQKLLTDMKNRRRREIEEDKPE
jgi:excisionase family DNA binding protein